MRKSRTSPRCKLAYVPVRRCREALSIASSNLRQSSAPLHSVTQAMARRNLRSSASSNYPSASCYSSEQLQSEDSCRMVTHSVFGRQRPTILRISSRPTLADDWLPWSAWELKFSKRERLRGGKLMKLRSSFANPSSLPSSSETNFKPRTLGGPPWLVSQTIGAAKLRV